MPIECIDVIDSSLLTNSDESTIFAFEGTQGKSKKGAWVVAPREGSEFAKSRSTFTKGTTSPVNGLRIKWMFASNAAGGAAPVFLQVTGLSERELKVPFLVVEWDGFGYTDMQDAPGYIVFIRSSSGEEPHETPQVQAAKYFHEIVYRGWIQGLMQRLTALGHVNPWAVSSFDSGQDFIKAVLLCLRDDDAVNLENFKISAARTEVGQPGDLQPTFKNVHAVSKITDATATEVTMAKKKRLLAHLKRDTEGKLNMDSKKISTIADFAACFSKILASCVSSTGIKEGYRLAGWTGADGSAPDLGGFMKQCRRPLTVEERKLIRDSSVPLAKPFIEKGHISDTELLSFGFEPDRHPVTGEAAHRHSEADHLQRAKSLSHPYQQQRRAEIIEAAQQKVTMKAHAHAQKIQSIFDNNKVCEEGLCEAAAVRALPVGAGLVNESITINFKGGWFAAKVTAYDADAMKHTVEYENDDDFSVGSKVEADYKSSGFFYPGTIKSICGDGSFDIEYDDGDQEPGVPGDRVHALADIEMLNLDGRKVKFKLVGAPEIELRDALASSSKEDFNALNSEPLKRFIHVRTFTTAGPPTGYDWGKKDDLVRKAFEKKGSPILFDAATAAAAAAAAATTAPVTPQLQVPPGPSVIKLPAAGAAAAGSAAGRWKAPDLIRDGAFRAAVESSLLGGKEPSALPVDTQAVLADALCLQLEKRLNIHILKRVEESCRDNFTLEFTRWMLPSAAAITVMFGHVKDDMSFVSLSDCALKAQTEYFCSIGDGLEISLGEGCYLYYDTLKGVWIRSGKVSGHQRNFKKRNDEHKENSKSPGANAFYLRNPHKDADASKCNAGLQKGFFHHLQQHCALGFSRSDADAVNNICKTNGARIFDWRPVDLDAMRRCSFYGSTTLKEKQLHMISYLFEIVYDLMLSDRDNISESPGFECCGLKKF